MNQNEILNMNLDCEKVKKYGPAERLYHQLVRYPQEIIPLMDHVLTDIFLERFENGFLQEGSSLKVFQSK